MKCRNCGADIDPQAAICINCGVPPASGRNFCQNCGATTDPNSIVCVKCGVSLAGAAPAAGAAKEGASALSIVSMVLALAGIITCVTSIPGFIMGLVELKKINRGESPQAGKAFALTAAIVGGILSGLFLLFVLFYAVIFIIAIASS